MYILLGQRDVNTSQWTAGLLEKGGRKHKLPLVCSSKENLGAKTTGVEMGKRTPGEDVVGCSEDNALGEQNVSVGI